MNRVENKCRRLYDRRLRRVINGTGIIIHTNMGRSPIPRSVWSAAEEANSAYSNLEIGLETGKRERREGILQELLNLLIGCQASTVVNNCAGALYLALTALAGGREVVISRGEQVQIGGGFRIPEILKQSGAKLVEVGTTNYTKADDYSEAIGENTAMVLLVHASNFEIRGFTDKPSVAEISGKIPEGVILAVDQGSGITDESVQDEMKAGKYIEEGADLICFSGDKVLGGPQAGIIGGREDLVDTIKAHPMMRALRAGKTIRSLLEEHLIQKLNGDIVGQAERVLSISKDVLQQRGETMARHIHNTRVSIVDSEGALGGGSAPGKTFPSVSIRITSPARPERLLEKLRMWSPPIIGTISENAVHLNLSTIAEEELLDVEQALVNLIEAGE